MPYIIVRIRTYISADIRLIACALGVLISCIAMTYIGCKQTIILSNTLMAIGWILLTLPSTKFLYFVTFLLLEVGSASSRNANIVYITDIIDPGLRGFFTLLIVGANVIGILLSYRFVIDENSLYEDWYLSILICAMFPFLSLMFSFAISEPPIRLILNGRMGQARDVFFWMHDETPQTESQFQSLVDFADKHVERREHYTFLSKWFFKPLVLVLLLCTTHICALFNPIVRYVYHKTFFSFEDIKQAQKYGIMILIVGNAVRFVMNFGLSLAIARVKRRPVFLISSFGSAYALMLLIVGEYLQLHWEPTFALYLTYILCASIGILSIPHIILAEYFPQHIRQYGSGLAFIYLQIGHVFTEGNVHPLKRQTDPIERNMLYWTSCVIILIITIVSFFIMPETEGLSLMQLENIVVIGPWIPTKKDMQTVMLNPPQKAVKKGETESEYVNEAEYEEEYL